MNEINPYQVSEANESKESAPEVVPQAIGGWLILVLIGLTLTPVRIGWALIHTYVPIFTNDAWHRLTTPGSARYHPLWGAVISIEVAGNFLILLLALVTLWFFLKKSRYTPRMMVAMYVFGLVFVVIDHFLAQQIPFIAARPLSSDTSQEMFRTIVAAVIWVPYFLVSKRVHSTFVRNWPRQAS